jgi:hypothetical protein
MDKELGILSVLGNSRLRVRLVSFAQSKYMEELPKFWLAVDELEKASGDSKMALARALYHTYLEPGSEQEVLLAIKERQRVGNELTKNICPDFGSLKREAAHIMESTLYPEFAAKVLTLSRRISSGASLSDNSGPDSDAESQARKQTHGGEQLFVFLSFRVDLFFVQPC